MSYPAGILAVAGIWMIGSAVPVFLSTAQAEPPSTFADERIEIEVGEPFTIARSSDHHTQLGKIRGFNFVTLQQISPERLFAKIWASPDASLEEKDINVLALWTEDGGRTWGKPALFQGRQSGGHSFVCRKDGTCVWLSYFLRPSENNDRKKLSANVGRSKDGKAFTWSVGSVSFPNTVRPWVQGNARMVFARSILEMDDGTLLATTYGRFEGDKLDRSVLVRSCDGGTTWKYVSTIAYDPAVGGEGLNEPCLIRLSNGELLCVMRNGSGRPMYLTRSKNDGLTFTQPEQLPDYSKSVFPDVIEMSHGVVAVSFGRPGNHIMFSLDGGQRWTKRTTIFAHTGSDSYTAIREVEPGRLLYAYNEVVSTDSGGRENEIRGVHIDVRRK